MIRIDALKYTPRLSTDDVNHLLGNKCSRLTCEIDFTVLEYFRSNANTRVEFAPSSYFTQDYISSRDNQPIFEPFNEGDVIDINATNASNDFTGVEIIEKVSDYVVRVDQTFVPEIDSDAIIEMATPISGISYLFGIIENNESTNFNSKVTGDEQKLSFENYPTGSTPLESMEWNSPIEAQIGSATIQRLQTGTSTNQQQFRLTHVLEINPVTIPAEYIDASNNVAPSYLSGLNTLKHVFKLQGSKDLTDPNLIHEITYDQKLGNVGWKDERFNAGETNYSISDLKFYRDATNDEVPALELTTDVQRIEFSVNNTVDSPFDATLTDFISHFAYVPNTTEEFTGTGKDLKTNFNVDTVLQTVGAGTVTGEGFGTDRQVFSGITATFDSASKIDVVILVTFSSAFIDEKLLIRGRRAFELNFEVQNHTLQTAVADLVTLDVEFSEFFNDVSDPTLATVTPLFFKAYEQLNVDTGESIINLRSEDNVKTKFQIDLDRNTRDTDEITTTDYFIELGVENTVDGIENIVENRRIEFDGGLDDTGESFIRFAEARPFKFPTGNEAQVIKAERRKDLDSGDLRTYIVNYPFIFRWENFISLQGLNDVFFDVNELNNGKNNDWNRLANFTDFNFFIRFTANFLKNGNVVSISNKTNVDTFTYLEDTDWINETIKFFRGVQDITPAIDASDLTTDTKVEVTKEYVGAGTLPEASEVEWIARIEVYQQGTIVNIRYLASWEDFTEFSWFKSIDSSNQIVKSRTGNVHKAEFLIDSAKIQQQNFAEGTQLKVSARLYDTINTGLVPADAKQLEDGTFKLTESGDYKILD